MRRLLPLVAAVLLIAPAAAQERAKNMLSVRGGATFAHLQVTLGSLRAATETRTGYHIEVGTRCCSTAVCPSTSKRASVSRAPAAHTGGSPYVPCICKFPCC